MCFELFCFRVITKTNEIRMIKISTVVITILLHVTAVMASTTEKQKNKLIHSEKEFEIRHYPSATLATVYSSVNQYKQISTPGFRTLAGYIFGGNTGNEKIAMTSPVHMDINDTLSSMSFVMPSKYEAKSLPTPNNSNIVLEKSPDEYVAALKFKGYASDIRIEQYSEKLKLLLEEKRISYKGNFRYLGYNPPYQFIGRRNEIIVTVNWNE